MAYDPDELTTLARAPSAAGEVALRRRVVAGSEVVELVVNGAFAMDSTEVASEVRLAELAVDHGARTVLVGGLGLGVTTARLVAAGLDRIDVVELAEPLVAWARAGLTRSLAAVAAAPAVHLHVADVHDVLTGTVLIGPGRWDAILLDVDNGPDFLIRDANADLYRPRALAAAVDRLTVGGVLVVWCQHANPGLAAELGRLGRVVEHLVPVRRDGHDLRYALYALTRPGRADPNPRENDGVTDTTHTMTGEFRVEHDTMGEVRVPAAALWKAQTQRAVENFPISGTPIEPALVAALGEIKRAAAATNLRLGVLDAEAAEAIQTAASEVTDGAHDGEFPIDVFQTGSGTSSNMNANEVIASLATTASGRSIHPNDHVNASQSSNDVFPSAIHIATTSSLINDLVPALDHLHAALTRKSVEFAEVVKSGRTHLMDATPVTLGQEFGGYARQIQLGVRRIETALPRVAELPLGGTAVGTGINTPPGFAALVIADVAARTGLPLTEAEDHFEAQGARDGLVEASGVLKTIAVGLTKIANDLRWMGSGPTAGLGEIALPDLQPGSSIMPGKVNPVMCEATLMVCAQVIGNDAAVTVAGAAGNFELNVMLPVIARNVLESIRLLANVSRLLADRCVDGITANVEHCRTLAESSPSIVTPLNSAIGYENAAAVAKAALKQGKTIRQEVIDRGFVADGLLTEAQLDAALDVLAMTRRPQ